MSEPNWNYMASAMQRSPFFAKGTEEEIEVALRIAGDIPSSPEEVVEESCGCVFCDLGLDTTQPCLGGGHYHEIHGKTGSSPARKVVLCPVKN